MVRRRHHQRQRIGGGARGPKAAAKTLEAESRMGESAAHHVKRVRGRGASRDGLRRGDTLINQHGWTRCEQRQWWWRRWTRSCGAADADVPEEAEALAAAAAASRNSAVLSLTLVPRRPNASSATHCLFSAASNVVRCSHFIGCLLIPCPCYPFLYLTSLVCHGH